MSDATRLVQSFVRQLGACEFLQGHPMAGALLGTAVTALVAEPERACQALDQLTELWIQTKAEAQDG